MMAVAKNCFQSSWKISR
uniref:Uncharacterized protein n=1 Tax=Arundo donax TaxID=35708 RepID=A0A0A9C4I7_ARUDO